MENTELIYCPACKTKVPKEDFRYEKNRCRDCVKNGIYNLCIIDLADDEIAFCSMCKNYVPLSAIEKGRVNCYPCRAKYKALLRQGIHKVKIEEEKEETIEFVWRKK